MYGSWGFLESLIGLQPLPLSCFPQILIDFPKFQPSYTPPLDPPLFHSFKIHRLLSKKNGIIVIASSIKKISNSVINRGIIQLWKCTRPWLSAIGIVRTQCWIRVDRLSIPSPWLREERYVVKRFRWCTLRRCSVFDWLKISIWIVRRRICRYHFVPFFQFKQINTCA